MRASSERSSENLFFIYSRGVEEKSQVPVINIANALTVLRLVLVPVLIWAFLDPTPERRWLTWGIFALAAATDQLDGHLARSRGLITNFGKLADSIADKFLILSTMVMLSIHGWLWWWVTIVFIIRELGITLMRMAMVKKKVMAAGRGGKIKMWAQSLGAGGIIIPWHAFLPVVVANVVVWLCYALIAVALFYAMSSALEYVSEARRISHEV
ncbi:CDP-diacylglycerol--glycerol-3-phosphate 3-phosphatidyltransferase [Trueperella pecoris]|nr:CDP-diacylglycerol--glycerol-3-phosphate 3-phosphatidyltransferase [Trueperella pecoris]QTG76162.1 CDP-diacylglycerol--glycerol-3-phosphate 3-phosphatidyltransferase [Trueperella pecoris]